MENVENKGTLSNKTQKTLDVVQICMRVFVVGATLASTWIMLSSKQVALVFGLPFAAKYSYSSSFRFFAYANACVCGLTLVSLLYNLFAGLKGGVSPNRFFFLFVADLCMTLLVLSASSAAIAEGHLGKYGNQQAGWLPICQYLNKYCDRVTVSVALSFSSVLVLLVSTILSAFRSRHNLHV